MRGLTPSRERTAFFVLVFAGSMLVLYASGQNWAAVTLGMPDPTPNSSETLKGNDLVPWVLNAPFFALASIAGVYATRRVGRVVIGAVLIWLGGAVIWGMRDALDQEQILARYQDRGAEQLTIAALNHGWWVLTIVGTALILIAGVFACARGAYWPRMGTRYDRARSQTPPETPQGARSSGAEEMWASLDAGHDPTASPPADDARQDIKEQ